MSGRRDIRYRLLLAAAGGAVFWERLWRRMWPAAGVGGVFLSVALLDLLPRLPGWGHALVLAAFAAALAVAAVRGMAGLRPAGKADARRRLERDSGLRHRPLTALEDRLTAGADDSTARALWRSHLERMARTARNLRVLLPAPGLARRDPLGLRAVVLLLLVIGAAGAGAEAPGRLARAMAPRFADRPEVLPTVELWITPPAYTGRAPLFLEGGAGQEAPSGRQRIEVPAGSALLVQADGIDGTPRLVVGATATDFTAIGPGGYRAETVIEQGDRLAVEAAGQELAWWPLRVIPDAPPRVSFTRPPAATGRSHLRLEYEAEDDYGIAGVSAIIHRIGGGPEDGFRVPLPVPGPRSAKRVAVRDLTDHPWAGLAVRIHLAAIDRRRQTGESAAVELVLPERIFTHPVARAIVAARGKLAWPTEGVRAEVAGELDAIAADPGAFSDDTVVYLALRVARARLHFDRRDDAVPSVRKLLWDTALGLEGGELSIAEQDMKRARERLMEALREGAGRREVERLTDQLQQALDRYLAELGRRLESLDGFEEAFEGSLRVLAGEDLRRLIEEARRLALDGAVDAARRLLSELGRLMDGIRDAIRPGAGGEDAREARRLMEALRALAGRQQQLLDDTFRDHRKRRAGGDRDRLARAGEGAADQEALRRRLGELMLRLDETLGDIPRSLGMSERAMREAVEALTLDLPGQALAAQGEALEQLRRGLRETAGKLARRLGGMWGVVGQRPGGGTGRDPFGRGPLGPYIDGSVEIPDRMEIRRARRLLQELRRRAGEHRRPKPERDYIERLLRRF